MNDREIGYITQSCRRCPRASSVVAAVLANSPSSVFSQTVVIRPEGNMMVTQEVQAESSDQWVLQTLWKFGGTTEIENRG